MQDWNIIKEKIEKYHPNTYRLLIGSDVILQKYHEMDGWQLVCIGYDLILKELLKLESYLFKLESMVAGDTIDNMTLRGAILELRDEIKREPVDMLHSMVHPCQHCMGMNIRVKDIINTEGVIVVCGECGYQSFIPSI